MPLEVKMAIARRAVLLLLIATPATFHFAKPATTALAQQSAQRQTAPLRVDSTKAWSRRELIDTYCVTCHNERLRTGGLTLNQIDTADVGRDAETWEKVLHKLRSGQMPPPRAPQPDQAAIIGFTSWLQTALDDSAAANPNTGRVGVHRLNRTEYANAIRDLMALEIDAKKLLVPDEPDEGFDNVASSLTVSPAHLERYVAAAQKISRLAIGDPAMGTAPAFALYEIPRLLAQDKRVSEDLPFGSRGGIAVRHHFSLDGEYAIKVRLRRQIYDYIIGLGEPQQLDVYVDGKLAKRLTVGGEGPGTPGPLSWVGEIVGDTEWELYMHAADAGLEVRVPVSAGTKTVAVSFVDRPRESEGIVQPAQRDSLFDEQYNKFAAIESVGIGGPYKPQGSGDTPSRRAIFVCRPNANVEEEACAKKILSTLARRAYRRPASDQEVDTLLKFYRDGRSEGGFEAGIQSAIERVLVSFNFLYRTEGNPRNATPGTIYRLSDIEFASRLSFFLWSSIPDDELLDLATRGKLKEPTILEGQVRRMLADRRSRTLVDNFANQWLTVRRVSAWQPDPNLFPDFDENLREAFLNETQLFIDTQFREDRSVIDLLDAKYTFVNDRLARHYGLPGVYGERFRRVDFSDGVRGGLLSQGSILMVTSYPDRTSPVLRGKWVLDNMLGMPPPPPPPNVPDLDSSKSEDGRTLSLREQTERHRKDPGCASCHVRMDPLGFALENFDAIGAWHKTDATAVLPDGTQFDGVAGLREFLLSHREDFVTTFTTKLMTYALGRAVEYYDYPAIRKVVREGAATNYRWSSIILGIVNSTPFQMRKAAS
jgi:hypothetical protein